jgi:hypothetical protein
MPRADRTCPASYLLLEFSKRALEAFAMLIEALEKRMGAGQSPQQEQCLELA